MKDRPLDKHVRCMMIKIAVPNKAFSANHKLVTELKDIFPDVLINTENRRFNGQDLIDFIGDAEAVIIGLEDFNKSVIDGCPKVKIVAKYGVGLDNVDVQYCIQKGIQIGWEGGVNRLSVAEMTLGYMLMLIRNIYITSNQLKSGFWNKNGGANLSGKVIGIIGVGYTGKELIRLLKPFSCRILVNDIIDQREFYESAGLECVDKETIFRKSDIVSLHTPATSLTRKMVNKDMIDLMKPSGIILNTARGELIDLNALKIALMDQKISGAAVDVYHEEPPKDPELLAIDNLITTPHIGGNSIESVMAMGRSAIRSLVEYREGVL